CQASGDKCRAKFRVWPVALRNAYSTYLQRGRHQDFRRPHPSRIQNKGRITIRKKIMMKSKRKFAACLNPNPALLLNLFPDPNLALTLSLLRQAKISDNSHCATMLETRAERGVKQEDKC